MFRMPHILLLPSRWTPSVSVGLTLVWLVFATTSGLNAQSKELDRHVILVSLDGLAAYLLDDPNASLPTLRKLAKEGTVVTGGMKVSNPSVTWPNHTTLITGVRPDKHGVLANGVLVRSGPGVPVRIDPARDHSELVRAKSIVDTMHEMGLRTGEVNWPCTRNSPSYDDSIPDVPDALRYTTPRLRDELTEMGLLTKNDDKYSFTVPSSVGKDWVWTETACHLIKTRKPHLLLVHLLNVDSTHHAFGSQTPAGYTANSYIDLCLARIVEATREAGILANTTFIVVSDHGFITTPNAIKPNVALRDAGLLKADGKRIVEARVHVVPEGGIGLVYCTNPLEAKELRQTIESAFQGKEGVDQILFPDRFAEFGLPMPREYEQAPDAVIAAKEGFSVSASVEGSEFVEPNTKVGTSLGSHGFLSTHPRMNATCILWGKDIQAGRSITGIENTSIAPTIAKLLGLPQAEWDGDAMDAAIRK